MRKSTKEAFKKMDKVCKAYIDKTGIAMLQKQGYLVVKRKDAEKRIAKFYEKWCGLPIDSAGGAKKAIKAMEERKT